MCFLGARCFLIKGGRRLRSLSLHPEAVTKLVPSTDGDSLVPLLLSRHADGQIEKVADLTGNQQIYALDWDAP